MYVLCLSFQITSELALTFRYLARIHADTPEGQIYGFEILVGIGTGCFIQAGYAVIQAVTPPEDMAYAISFMMLAQLSGIALGLAISGAVFVNDAIANLSAVLTDASREQLQMAISGTSGDYLSSLSEDVRTAATNAIVEALRKVFIPVYVAAAFALVLSVMFTVCLSLPLLILTSCNSLLGTQLICRSIETQDVWRHCGHRGLTRTRFVRYHNDTMHIQWGVWKNTTICAWTGKVQ